MTKTLLAALAVLSSLSAPAFASIVSDHRAVVAQQEEPAPSADQPAGEGESESGGGGD